MDWLNITMKTTTELFVTVYNYSKEDSICLWLTVAWLFNIVHWVGHYPVEKF